MTWDSRAQRKKAPAKHSPSDLTVYPLYKAKGVLRATVFQEARTLGDHWKPGHPKLEWEGLHAENGDNRQAKLGAIPTVPL